MPHDFESLKRIGQKFGIAISRFDPSSRGLGDTVAKATAAVGIVPCGACKKRQEALNNAVPYQEKK